ncbi:WD40 repeat domain-containing protein [Ktedonosporobacter rubrisoli]|uniref:WD40 repeat domain-containing protein n=1 Tax=Ktedonosporobacter rubrisoli TaxID=2509675 RepID=A0A4P6K1F2_KTERU|nr:WD40 repeat domain-containing protein [Ktedonosporobacter rubrisoli]QBD81663.1 WD40 repeat domain-containing protein [Ktedonosporobacter rubrisoli]
MNDKLSDGKVRSSNFFPESRLSRRGFIALLATSVVAGCGTTQKPTQQLSPTPTPTPSRPTPTPDALPTSAPAALRNPTQVIGPENADHVSLLGVISMNNFGAVRGVGWSPNSSVLAAGAYKIVQLWDSQTGKNLATLQGHTEQVYATKWSPDGNLLATASEDQSVLIWDIKAQKVRTTIQEGNYPFFISLAWSPDGTRLVTGNSSGNIQLWDSQTGQKLATWNGSTPQSLFGGGLYPTATYGLDWSPDGKRVATTRYDGFVQIWDAVTGRQLTFLETRDQPNDTAWSPDGRSLASSNDDGTIQLWDTATWKNSQTLNGHNGAGWAYALAWSKDGHVLAAAHHNGLIQLWDSRAAKEQKKLTGHTQGIWSMALSADGMRLASGSDDGTIRLWGVYA